jgi:hypothetical protein
MNRTRWRQLLAVFRLEIGKSFLSRRGAWIYALALLPVLLFLGHGWITARQHRWRVEHASPGLTRQDMQAVQPGMPRDELLRRLPHPGRRVSFTRRGEPREVLTYSDGSTEWRILVRSGKVASVTARSGCDWNEDKLLFAAIFQVFFLRLVTFFGCLFVFLNLIRGEVLDKSLHYYFLTPVKRELIVIGKYLAGLVATTVIFTVSVALQLVVLYFHFAGDEARQHLLGGEGVLHVAQYLGITALACVGYGGVFLVAGVLGRNPLIPAALVFLWESINGVLPSALRKVSIIYYLKSLCPVEIPISRDVPPPLALLAVNVDPAPAWLAIPGLLVVAAAMVAIAAWRTRQMEISYAAD